MKKKLLDCTRSDATSVPLTRNFMIESWGEGGIAQSQKIEQNCCNLEYAPFISYTISYSIIPCILRRAQFMGNFSTADFGFTVSFSQGDEVIQRIVFPFMHEK